MNLVPKKVFLTTGSGIHAQKICSFEMALRAAGIEKCNLVSVSSIFPPNCEIVTKEEGAKLIQDGEITFAVISRNESNVKGHKIAAAVGLAYPKAKDHHGYFMEHHEDDDDAVTAGREAEEMAIEMLLLKYNTNNANQINRENLESTNVFLAQELDEKGKWITIIAAAVFIL